MPVTVKLCDLLSPLEYVEIFQNDKTGLLMSKVCSVRDCMPLVHRFLNSLDLHNFRISPQLYRLCSQRAVSLSISQILPKCSTWETYFKNLGEREDGTKEEMRRGKRFNEPASKKNSYLLKPINTH